MLSGSGWIQYQVTVNHIPGKFSGPFQILFKSMRLKQNCFASKNSPTVNEPNDLGPHIVLCLDFLIYKVGRIIIPILASL